MKCSNHLQSDSVAFCVQCGRALCGECKRDVRGIVYCENCLAARVQGAGLPPVPGLHAGHGPGVVDFPSVSSQVALVLGFIPGVGAIYNGQVIKAIVQVLIFGALIALRDRIGGPMGTICGFGAVAFYFYMVINSYQTARRKQLGLPAEDWFGLGDTKMNAPWGAVLLVALGALLLLDNLGIAVFRHISKFWPVLLIVAGVLLLQRRMGGGAPQAPSPEAPGPPRDGPSNIPGPQGM